MHRGIDIGELIAATRSIRKLNCFRRVFKSPPKGSHVEFRWETSLVLGVNRICSIIGYRVLAILFQ